MQFESRKEYVMLLGFLNSFCDQIKIVEDEDSIFQTSIAKYATEYRWTRRFPGYNGGSRFKVISYATSKEVMDRLKAYNNFSEIDGDETDLDIAFYRNDKLVFWFLGHEDLWVLEESYLEEYSRFCLKSSMEAMG